MSSPATRASMLDSSIGSLTVKRAVIRLPSRARAGVTSIRSSCPGENWGMVRSMITVAGKPLLPRSTVPPVPSTSSTVSPSSVNVPSGVVDVTVSRYTYCRFNCSFSSKPGLPLASHCNTVSGAAVASSSSLAKASSTTVPTVATSVLKRTRRICGGARSSTTRTASWSDSKPSTAAATRTNICRVPSAHSPASQSISSLLRLYGTT